MKSLLKIAFMIGFVCASARPQTTEFLSNSTDGLKIATIFYQNGEYREAYQKFNALAERFPGDGHNSIFRFMAAKSLYKAGDHQGAIDLWDQFISDFPGSDYIGDAKLLKGHCLYEMHDLAGAASEYIEAIDFDPKQKSAQIARTNLIPLVSRGLIIKQLRDLIEEQGASSQGDVLKFTLARREIDSGQYRKGIRSLKSFLAQFPNSKQAKQARALLGQATAKSEGSLAIGLLAPLTNGFEEYGRAMAEGAGFAMRSLGGDSLKVTLIVKDTETGPIVSAKVATSLANEEPIAVVGPLTSESSVGAAVALNDRDIPMITPTASESGLSTIGPNIFQISPSIERIGQALGAYAVKNLGIKEFAIIAPDDAAGQKITQAFSQAVYKYGGVVISTSYYTSGATDFKQQILPLRDILLTKTQKQLAAGDIDSSQFLDPKAHLLLDKDDWPVNLGGLFLPGYPDDLKLLVPQIRYRVIHTRFLGPDSWDSDDLIREVRQYVGDAVFATDFHVGSGDKNWSAFSKTYSAVYGHQPDKVAGLTYDAMGLILSGLKQGITTPERLRDYLSNIEEYRGVSCVVTFKGTDRANSEVGIYSIDGKRLATVR